MRVVLALIVACLVAACGFGAQSSGERALLWGDSVRSARAALDVQAILQGMDEARGSDQRVARDINRRVPETPPAPVTR